jgi:hypothetical protein
MKKSIESTQNIKITTSEAKKLEKIVSICESNKFLGNRFLALNKEGFYESEKPMKTGFGIGRCVTRMANGDLRVRVSANWGVNFGNYAHCVTI